MPKKLKPFNNFFAMDLNLEELIEGLSSILKNELEGGKEEIKDYAYYIIEKRKQRLKELAELYTGGFISKEEVESELADEEKVVEAHLLAMQVKAKASIQQAANASIEFITHYILKLL
jgi:hypothetical protein